MNRTTATITIVSLVVLAGAAGGAYYLQQDAPPDPAKQKPEETAKFMASEAFAKLDDAAREKYYRDARKATSQPAGMRGRFGFRPSSDVKLTDEEHERLRENVRPIARKVREEQMRKQMDEFFALPAEKRVAALDERIDQMTERMKQWRERRAAEGTTRPARAERRPSDSGTQTSSGTSSSSNSEAGGGRRRRGPTPERFKRRIETTDPEDRARFMEYIKALRARMQERGIPMRGRGRGH
jgi:hypothetical protein